MEDYSITHGKRMSAGEDDVIKKAATTHQSVQHSLMNASLMKPDH